MFNRHELLRQSVKLKTTETSTTLNTSSVVNDNLSKITTPCPTEPKPIPQSSVIVRKVGQIPEIMKKHLAVCFNNEG
jgi:hypothetical protein